MDWMRDDGSLPIRIPNTCSNIATIFAQNIMYGWVGLTSLVCLVLVASGTLTASPTDEEIMKEIETEVSRDSSRPSAQFLSSLKDPTVGLGQLPANIMSPDFNSFAINPLDHFQLLNDPTHPLHPLNMPLHPLSLPPPLQLPDTSPGPSPLPLPSPFQSSGKDLFPNSPLEALDHGVQRLTLLLQTAQKHRQVLREQAKKSLQVIRQEKRRLKHSVSEFKTNKVRIGRLQKDLGAAYREQAVHLLREQAENAKEVLSKLKESAKGSEGLDELEEEVLGKVAGIQEQIGVLQELLDNSTNSVDLDQEIEGLELDSTDEEEDGEEINAGEQQDDTVSSEEQSSASSSTPDATTETSESTESSPASNTSSSTTF